MMLDLNLSLQEEPFHDEASGVKEPVYDEGSGV